MLTQTYLKSVFKYENGQLYWIGNRRGANKNKPVGYTRPDHYLSCSLDGKHYLLHRLIFLYVNGNIPDGQIDHINGNRSDNRIENLRAVTAAGNRQNLHKALPNNASGLLGAFFQKKTKKWKSTIGVNGKRLHLGMFNNPNEAHQAYIKAKRELHPNCTI